MTHYATETWQELLNDARQRAEDWSALVRVAPDPSVMFQRFDSGFGTAHGPPVLVWTKARVYFPVVYDGSEWLGSAPRNPTDDGQPHEGGQ